MNRFQEISATESCAVQGGAAPLLFYLVASGSATGAILGGIAAMYDYEIGAIIKDGVKK